jgi:hypothetical protein
MKSKFVLGVKMLEVTVFRVIQGAGSLVELAGCNGGWAIGESFGRDGVMMFRIKMMFSSYIEACTAYDKQQDIVTNYFIRNGAGR